MQTLISTANKACKHLSYKNRPIARCTYICMTYVDLFHMSNASRSIYARIRGVQKNLSSK